MITTTHKENARIFDLYWYGSLARIKSHVALISDGLEMKFRKLPYDGQGRYIFWFVDDSGIKNYLS